MTDKADRLRREKLRLESLFNESPSFEQVSEALDRFVARRNARLDAMQSHFDDEPLPPR